MRRQVLTGVLNPVPRYFILLFYPQGFLLGLSSWLDNGVLTENEASTRDSLADAAKQDDIHFLRPFDIF